MFGSVAMLLYGLLGAPDVALTEAMVGTLLSTTLYVIALRSSMTLRIEDRRTRSPQEEPDRQRTAPPLDPTPASAPRLVRRSRTPWMAETDVDW